MRIAAVRVRPVRLRFTRPAHTSRGACGERASVLLELRDRDGRVGYGEAAPWPGFATESVADAEGALRSAERWLVGQLPVPDDVVTPLAELLRDRPAARAALEGARWDLAARQAGRPLAVQLAASRHPPRSEPALRVAVSALLAGRDPPALRDAARRARADGYRAVKVKLGSADLASDVACMRALREGLGTGVRLRCDANGAWTFEQAAAALEALAPFDVEYVEQPVAAHDIEGLADLRRRGGVPVAADESVVSEQGLLRLLAADAADVVVLKPALLGGPCRALELAAQARQAGVGVVFTHAFETAVGARHALHCAAAWGDDAGVHGLVTAGLFESDVAAPVEGRAGHAAVPADPGLGVTL